MIYRREDGNIGWVEPRPMTSRPLRRNGAAHRRALFGALFRKVSVRMQLVRVPRFRRDQRRPPGRQQAPAAAAARAARRRSGWSSTRRRSPTRSPSASGSARPALATASRFRTARSRGSTAIYGLFARLAEPVDYKAIDGAAGRPRLPAAVAARRRRRASEGAGGDQPGGPPRRRRSRRCAARAAATRSPRC